MSGRKRVEEEQADVGDTWENADERKPHGSEAEEPRGWGASRVENLHAQPGSPAICRFMQPGKGVKKRDFELLQPAEELLLTPFAPRLVVSAAVRCGAHARALQFLEEDLIDQVPVL